MATASGYTKKRSRISSRSDRSSSDSTGGGRQTTLTELFDRPSTSKLARSSSGRLEVSMYENESEVIELSSQEEKEVLLESKDDCSHVSESPPLSPTLSLGDQLSDTPTWTCIPLNELCFGPSATPILSPLHSSTTHCVTFTPVIKPRVPPTPTPPRFKDVWDEGHVRMPCSVQCLYPVDVLGGSKLEKKWELIIQSLSKPINNTFELEEAILSYNTRFSSKWKFKLIHSYFTEYASEDETKQFFNLILPRLVKLALALPQVMTHAVPLLHKQQMYSLTLSQHQIACLLANAFFCTFPRRNTTAPKSEYSKFPSINFNTLFCSYPISVRKINKLRCILHYFERVLVSMPTGTVTFSRQVTTGTPNWDQCTHVLSKLHVTSHGTIEGQGHGMLQVDFANKFIGGGVLGNGCVQEEIRFLICPELIITRLFTEELDANESLLMIGAEQFSNYRGYSDSFEWSGNFIDQTLSDVWGRKQVHIVAIDALVFRSRGAQYQRKLMERELNKAYSGFIGDGHRTPSNQLMAVATGNWGCGAFRGEAQLKALLQWMACSVAGRDVVYFTFDKTELLEDLRNFHEIITSKVITIADLWHLLNRYYAEIIKEKRRVSLLQYLTLEFSQK